MCITAQTFDNLLADEGIGDWTIDIGHLNGRSSAFWIFDLPKMTIN